MSVDVVDVPGIEQASRGRAPGQGAPMQGAPVPGWPGLGGTALSPFAALAVPGLDLARQAADYWVDQAQRGVLFWDTLRRRGNQFLEHRRKGCPPVLQFAYEIVLDGRALDRPVNYALCRILPDAGMPDTDPALRPYVVIDPRAGHGPGIGGSKKDSQIGIALRAGHPVYFVTFFPEPVPGQTIPDVAAAEARFLEEVAHRHPLSKSKPCVVGNCQAGWAVAMLGAARPDVTGPIVLNGAPMSYWAGTEGRNPMRYRGGLYGGTWLSSLASDLGNGVFDGAYLVQNFEALNPANTLWTKQYNLYAKIDSEDERYLEFERWWGGFFLMNREEMAFIVNNLFVGNKLGKGDVALTDGQPLDLRNIKSPVILFASAGDNITPPQQALNWIADVYGDDETIKLGGHVIIYLLHQDIGHLGIFVSGKVAQREHSEILGVLDHIEMLPPGLYEMIIDDYDPEVAAVDSRAGAHTVHFAERSIKDIMALDDGREDEAGFASVEAVSRLNERAYGGTLRPLIRAMANEPLARLLRELHPMRLQRSLISDLNPLFWGLGPLADTVRRRRAAVAPDNPFLGMEHKAAKAIEAALNRYRDQRDEAQERLFQTLYGPQGAATLMVQGFGRAVDDPEHAVRRHDATATAEARADLLAKTESGGFAEAMVRIIAAVLLADGSADRREIQVSAEILAGVERLRAVTPDAFRRMLTEQTYIVQADRERAIAALPAMLPAAADRMDAMMVAQAIALADLTVTDEEREVVVAIGKALGL